MEIITTHLHADFDGLAAMAAAKRLYPEAVMVFPGSQEKNVRAYLAQHEGRYRFARLKDIDFAAVTRLIVVDTREKKRLGPLNACLANPGIEVHLYDHHPATGGSLQGQKEEIRAVGSTTTIFAAIFQERGIAPDPELATLMHLAIHEDTGSFIFDTTTPEDHQAAAFLLAHGAESGAVSRFIAQELSSREIDLLHQLIMAARTYTIAGVEIIVTRIDVPDYIDDFAVLVRKFMVMENVNALFAIAGMGDRVYLIARSRIPEVNAGKLAVAFGGGGHASAASATIREKTIIEVEEQLIALLHKEVRPVRRARDLMSAPVISVPPATTIDEAHERLTRYSITVLPVLEPGEKVVGLISRRVVEKAIFHGLGALPVADYMSTDFAVVEEDADLREIQELIIGARQRFIPVVKKGRVRGVITRTDLLNLLIKDPRQTPVAAEETERHRNLNALMASCLSRRLIVLLRTIGEAAAELGYAAYAVGGFVRDLLLREPNLDLDVVIEGDGIAFAKRLAATLGGEVRAHEKFNTAVVRLADGFKIDVATARLEYYEYPAAMPTVEMGSIKLDLFRRDFTINAMAVHLNPGEFGTLVDFFNCQNDLHNGQIRVLHNLSFVEDPTRIFRAIRFEQRLGFTLGSLTAKLIKNAVRMEMYGRFSGRRFFLELKMILSEENPLPAIYRMDRFRLLHFLHPALKLDTRLKNILRETHRSLAWYKRLYLDDPYAQWEVFLMALTAKLTVRQFAAFCEKFEIPERRRERFIKDKVAVGKIIRILNQRPLGEGGEAGDTAPPPRHGDLAVKGPPLRPSEVYWLLKGLGTNALLHLMGIATRQTAKKAISHYVTTLRGTRTLLDGTSLRKMGYRPGPLFTTILNHLLEARLDGLVRTRKDEKRFVKTHYPKES